MGKIKNDNDLENDPKIQEILQLRKDLHELADRGELPEDFFETVSSQMGKLSERTEETVEKLRTLDVKDKYKRKIMGGKGI
jgi:arginine deiminase